MPEPAQQGIIIAENVALQELDKNKKRFKPTEGMIKWFNAATEIGFTASICDIAKQAKLHRDNWYQWLEKEGFVEWWDSMWKQYISVNRWRLDAIGMKKAETDYQYWHDMMQRVGNLQPNNGFNEEIGFVFRRR